MIIDMHSHILPGADHGSDSVKTSLAQLARARKAKVDVILATPHFYHHRDNIDDFLARRQKCYEKLSEAMKTNGYDAIQVFLGAEVTLEVDLLREKRLPELCIQGTNRLLLEMPADVKWTEWVYNAVYEIEAKYRIEPIIAHIDRYESKQTAKLLEMGVDAQINASSLCRFSQRGKMMKYVKQGIVKFLGSDIHGPESPEYDEFAKGVKVLGDYADDIMTNSARALGLIKSKIETGVQSAGGLIF